MDDLAERYQTINNSYKKEYIFHMGAEAGFYSELSNMVFAILYCLKYEYKFIMYSKDANFGYNRGWRDFFLSFCSESTFLLHRLYNKRIETPYIRQRHRLLWKIYRKLNKNTLLTYELWDKYFCDEFDKEHFNFPTLGIQGDLREASAVILNMIYRYNDRTREEIQQYLNKVNLPQDYLAMQIRRGDKITECTLCPTDEYFKVASSISSARDLFVLTDDYGIIEEVKADYKDWNIFTLTSPDEKGYDHNAFSASSSANRKAKLLKLFASIEIIRQSKTFIGTYTANLALFLGMAMPFDKVISVQRKSWFRFSDEDIKDQLV